MSKFSEEHDRYEIALKRISETYGNAARLIAINALNPPGVPVTMEAILEALRERNKATALGLHNITIFSDGSGHVSYGDGTGYLFHFETLQRALELIKT